MCEDPEKRKKIEKEASKILRKLGFPDKEQAVTTGQMVQKASTCLVKRLATIDELKELLTHMTKSKPEDKGISEPTACRSLC